MKTSTILLLASTFAFAPLHMAAAQAPPGTSAQQPASAPAEQLLKAGELDQLVAPIALYPDTLLAEILMASTYPLEVVQADRWAKANKNLKGDQLKTAAEKQSWDESVKSLVATPSVLADMSTKLDWTQKLGDAVLAQQADVMDAVQRLRNKAQASKALASTKEQKVSVQKVQNKDIIVIEPTTPDTIYVPYYDPAVVYGAWAYPAYPPYYFAPPAYIAAGVIRTGLAFGAGYAIGRWASGGNYWGGGVNWGNNNINVNRNTNINVNNNWQHNSAHRQGVKYNNTNVQNRYANNNIRSSSNQRNDFRGRDGNQVIKPGNAGNVGDRGPGNRPNAGDRAPNRPQTADRSPGNRQNAGNRPSSGANRPAAKGPQRESGLGNIQTGRAAHQQSGRGQASLGGRGGGGGHVAAGGGGRGGGGGGRGGGGRGGGGRR